MQRGISSFLLLSVFFIAVLSVRPANAQTAGWQIMAGKQGSDGAGLIVALHNKLFAAVDNSLYSTTDNGNHWIQTDTPVSLSQAIDHLVIRNGDLFASLTGFGDFSSLYRSTDEGKSWTSCNVIASGAGLAANDGFIMESGGWSSYGIFRSADGIIWDELDSIDAADYVNCFAMNDEITALIALRATTDNSTIISSRDFGITWQIGTIPSNSFHALAVDGYNIFVASDSGIYRSYDFGSTWKVVTPFSRSRMIAVHGALLLAASDENGILFSSDSGDSWHPWNDGLPNSNISAIAIGDSEVYAALLSGGIYYSKFPVTSSENSEGCALSSWVMQQQPHSAGTPTPPLPLRDTVITVNGSQQHISLPAGFTMTVFASNVDTARGLALSPDGVIYATGYSGKVYALPDHNHDGFADSIIVVASGLGDPHGIGFYKGELYVSNNSALYHVYTHGMSRVADSLVQIAALPPSGGHHSRNFVIDTFNDKIYLQIGSNGNIDTTDFAHRAQIVEMNPDGSAYRTYASGVRNAVGMDIDPRTGALWVNNNGMDNIFGSNTQGTDDNPLESIYLVCDGANYGWPWCYAFRLRNPLMPDLDTSIVQTFDGPVAEIEAHSAPLGLHFYRGTKFPPIYHNAIFQCYHGSWDRSPPAPPRVTVMWADTDGKNARIADFITGFMVPGAGGDSNTGHYFGRPVSVIEGADSALYVSDDQEGVIYRIAYTGEASGVSRASDALKLEVSDPVPNPAERTLTFSISGQLSFEAHLDIFDETGRNVLSKNIEEAGGNISLDISTLIAGTYTLRVSAAGELVTRRFAIER